MKIEHRETNETKEKEVIFIGNVFSPLQIIFLLAERIPRLPKIDDFQSQER